MKLRKEIDPELHTIRSAIKALDGRTRGECETARFGLYAAFESRDPELATRWAGALRMALLTAAAHETVRVGALQALGVIEQAIGD